MEKRMQKDIASEQSASIAIREAVAEPEVTLFWEELRQYQKRDLFPDMDEEDREYFAGEEYREEIQRLHDRAENRCRYLLFEREGQKIGLAMMVLYEREDGKCLLMEFAVFPQFRGGGTGSRCAKVFLDWAKGQGASCVELNCDGSKERIRFWQRMGFVLNGRDEWGVPLMLLPPKEISPATVVLLEEPQDWQLMKLENGYLGEIGEEVLTEERKERLKRAVAEKKIFFFLAMCGARAVGMCSVSLCFSTFACGMVGQLEDFYVEPVFRKRGIARKLARTAQDWCGGQGVSSLTVCCAPCDEKMYQALGFSSRLGSTYAFVKEEISENGDAG